MFDGSKNEEAVRAGIVLVSPKGKMFQFAYELDETLVLSNNKVEYETLKPRNSHRHEN